MHAVFLPSLKGYLRPDGQVTITKKFHDGVLLNLEYWDGPITVVMEQAPEESHNLDNIPVDPKSIPYTLKLVESFREDEIMRSLIADADVVLGTVGWQQSKLSSLCNELGVACLYCTEYTLKTRLQIVSAEVDSPVIRARRYAFEVNQERRNQLAIRVATGVQCNGTPTFEVYRHLNRSPHLYFDNRTRAKSQIEEEALENRLLRLDESQPLRLLYSGRLDAMKGADHLPAIARELMRRDVPFEMSICGGGRLEPRIRQDLAALRLSDQVRMRGVLDFDTQLLPLVKEEVDLFVCPHVQGDPSCTYVETFGCGVPMVGFDNEAFAGIVKHAEVGTAVPTGDVEATAEAIAALHRDRDRLKRYARVAAAFARRHTFESMVEARVEHMRACIGASGERVSIGGFVSGQVGRLL